MPQLIRIILYISGMKYVRRDLLKGRWRIQLWCSVFEKIRRSFSFHIQTLQILSIDRLFLFVVK